MFKKYACNAVCVIAYSDSGQVLTVTRRNSTILALPGGKVDEGETLVEAAVRELHEETGVEVDPEQLIPIFSQVINGKVDFYCTTFLYDGTLAHNTREWQLEEGIVVSFRTTDELLTGGDFFEYNTAALQNAERMKV